MPSVAELQIVLTAKDEASGVLSRVGASAEGALGKMANIAKDAALALAAVGAAAGGLVAATGFGFNSMMENAQISFTTLTGSAEKAKTMLADLQEFARTSPFDTPGIIAASQRLMAMGFTADEVKPTLTALGNAMAAVGGNSDMFSRAAISIGQMAASAKASSREMRELVMAGIPAWDILAEQMHKTVGEVQADFESGAISGKQASEMLLAGMEQRYHGMMDTLSRAGSGLLSNLKDTFAQLSGVVMKPLYDRVVEWMQKIADITGTPEFRESAAAWGQSLSDALDRVIPLIQKVALAFFDLAKEYGPMVLDFVVNLGAMLIDLAQAALPYIQEALGKLGGIIEALWHIAENAIPGIKAFVGALADVGAWDATMAALDGLKVALEWLADHEEVLVAALFGIAAALAVVAVSATAAAIATAAAAAPLILIGVAAGVAALAAIEIVKNWDSVAAVFEAAGEAAESFMANTRDSIGEWKDAVVDAFKTFGDLVTTFTSSFKDAMGTAWSQSRDSIGEWKDAVVDAFKTAGDVITTWASSLDDALYTASANIRDWAGETKDDIVDMFADAGEWLYEAGRELVQGLWDGAKSNAEDFLGWIGEKFNPANWDIPGFSPFIEAYGAIGQKAGGALGDGVATGIQSGQEAAVNAAISMTNAVGSAAVTNLAQWQLEMARQGIFGQYGAAVNEGLLPGESNTSAVNAFQQFDTAMKTGLYNQIIGGTPSGARPSTRGVPPSSGGGGGGSAKAKEEAVSAADQFAADYAHELEMQDWEALLGETGSKIMEAFTEAVTADEKSQANAAHALFTAVKSWVAEAEKAGVKGARELGNSFMEQIGQAITDKSPEEAKAVIAAMQKVFDPAAVKLTMNTFNESIANSITEAHIEDVLGSKGIAMMGALNKALTEGGQKNVDALARMAVDMKNTLVDKLPADQAAYLGTKMMTLLGEAIKTGSDEDIGAFKEFMAQLNIIMQNGAIDIRTGTIYFGDQIKNLAKEIGVSGEEVIKNLSFFVDSGLLPMVDKLNLLPETAQKAIAGIVQAFLDKKIPLGEAVSQIMEILRPFFALFGVNPIPGEQAAAVSGAPGVLPGATPGYFNATGPTIPGVPGYNVVWVPGKGWTYQPALSSYAGSPVGYGAGPGGGGVPGYGVGLGWGVDPATGKPYTAPGTPGAAPGYKGTGLKPAGPPIPVNANSEGVAYYQHGGVVPYDMLAYVHKGETVIPAGSSSSSGGATARTINFYGNGYGRTVEELAKLVRDELDRSW